LTISPVVFLFGFFFLFDFTISIHSVHFDLPVSATAGHQCSHCSF